MLAPGFRRVGLRVNSLVKPGTGLRGDVRFRDSCMVRTCVRWARPRVFAVRRESQPMLVVVRSFVTPPSQARLGAPEPILVRVVDGSVPGW